MAKVAVSMHGLTRVTDPSVAFTRRVIWGIILLTGLGFSFYNIINQALYYSKTPINVRFEIIRKKLLPFPVITLCNYNALTLSSIRAWDLQDTVMNMYPLWVELNQTEPNLDQYNFTGVDVEFWREFYDIHSHEAKDLVVQCEWETEKCTAENFTKVFTDMGNCFSFNDGKLKVRNSGHKYGLQLSLNTLQHEYLRSREGYMTAGFKVMVHPPGVPPTMGDSSFGISPGYNTFVGLTMRKMQNIDSSISNCGTVKLNYSDDYNVAACNLECKAEYFTSLCGCRDYQMPNTDARVCNPKELYECIIKQEDRFIQDSSTVCNCPEACNETVYQPLISSSPMSEYFYTEYSRIRGGNESYWRKNFVKLDIYFTDMTYESIEKQLGYDLRALFCDIGGALGLTLGASFATLLEVFDVLFVNMFQTNRVQAIPKKT